MKPETKEFHKEILDLTLQAARALVWHDRREGWPKYLEGATCFFLQFESGIIGVTAAHVIDAYECAFASNPYTVCQLRNSPAFDLSGAIISYDSDRDIATFEVSAELVSDIEAIPLDCRGSWPPPEPKYLQALTLCGFPETLRSSRDDSSAEFQAYGALSAAEHITSDEIWITYDLSWAEAGSWAPNLPPIGFNMSGCSGGPVLSHGVRNGLHRWFPVALISQGPKEEGKQGEAAEFDVIRLRRIHIIKPDGTLMESENTSGGWLPG